MTQVFTDDDQVGGVGMLTPMAQIPLQAASRSSPILNPAPGDAQAQAQAQADGRSNAPLAARACASLLADRVCSLTLADSAPGSRLASTSNVGIGRVSGPAGEAAGESPLGPSTDPLLGPTPGPPLGPSTGSIPLGPAAAASPLGQPPGQTLGPAFGQVNGPSLGPAMMPGKGVRRIRCIGCSRETLPRHDDGAPLCPRCSDVLASAGTGFAGFAGFAGTRGRPPARPGLARTSRWLRRRSALD